MESDASPAAGDRDRVRRMLAAEDWPGLSAWARSRPGAVRILLSLLQDPDERISLGSARALGEAVAGRGSVRQVIRRLFWSMNDESGSLIPRAPEAVAEILLREPRLIPEFGPILGSYLDESPFEAGVRRALARLAPLSPPTFRHLVEPLRASLASPDPEIRQGSAALLRALGVEFPASFDHENQ